MAPGSGPAGGAVGLRHADAERRAVFTPNQALRLDRALTAADTATGLRFSVYLGDLGRDSRATAELLLSRMGPEARRSVVVALSPEQRIVEIVTGADAKRILTDRVCGLAVVSMTSSFGVGDFTGGLVAGLDVMREQAARV